MAMFNIGDQFNELVKVTLTEKQVLREQTDHNIEVMDQSAKSQNFFRNNKPSERKYTTTGIKSRKFLSNFAMSVLVKRIFTMKILFLTFIYFRNVNRYQQLCAKTLLY